MGEEYISFPNEGLDLEVLFPNDSHSSQKYLNSQVHFRIGPKNVTHTTVNHFVATFALMDKGVFTEF